ncbi:hypothetical protein B296_00053995 [Ensete ventricosum]|uniref:Uncharacterized protein n=1 Tax=Ensete ventricosum TaxID=4639 RepID=A0A426XH53_ENSVE|nr:hypothetical protein B296_00053995 [Ensete ventricosum]
MRFACFLGEVIAPLQEVETFLGEARPPLISFIALLVKGHFYFFRLSLPALELSNMVNLNLVHGLSKMGGGRPSSAAPAPVQPAAVPYSPPEVQEIRSEEVTKKEAEAFGKRLIEGSKSRAAKGKGPASPVDEALAPRTRPKLVRELCNTHPGVDGRDYHVIRMSSLSSMISMSPRDAFVSPNTWYPGLARRGGFDEVCMGGAYSLVGGRLVHIAIRGSD